MTRRPETATESPRPFREVDWYEKFQPHIDDNQTAGFVNYDYQTAAELSVLQQANAERKLWTYCHTPPGNYYITQGWALVNREFYVITAVPSPAGVWLEIDMGPTAFCEYCGEWFADFLDGEERDDAVERSTTDPLTCVTCQTGDEVCASCGDAFGSGEFAKSRCDASLCHYCYTNGEEEDA